MARGSGGAMSNAAVSGISRNSSAAPPIRPARKKTRYAISPLSRRRIRAQRPLMPGILPLSARAQALAVPIRMPPRRAVQGVKSVMVILITCDPAEPQDGSTRGAMWLLAPPG